MTFTISIPWWFLPTIITIAGVAFALVYDGRGTYYGSGLINLFYMVIALGVSLVSWAIAAFLK
jgi:hypothetical protein